MRKKSNSEFIRFFLNSGIGQRWAVHATREDREDLSQECLLALWQKERAQGRQDGSLYDGLRFVICRRQLNDFRGKHMKHDVGTDSFDIGVHDHAGPPNALSEILAQESFVRIAQTDREQAVAVMVFFGGVDQEDTAKKLGFPVTTVNSMVARMRQRMEDLGSEQT